MISTFYSLLQSALWQRSVDAAAFEKISASEWNEIYALARSQTVTALVFNSVSQLPERFLPPEQLLMRWLAETESIRLRSLKMDQSLSSLLTLLSGCGITPVVLKGQILAALYPDPEARQCGDIDLYIPDSADIGKILKVTKATDASRHPDGATSFSYRGFLVELHPYLLDIHSHKSLRRLSAIPSATALASVPLPDGEKATSTAPESTILMLTAHAFKHAAGRGIGLRQLCDIAVASRKLSAVIQREEMAEILRAAGLRRWSRMLYSFLVLRLGLDPDAVPFDDGFTPSEKSAAALERIVLAGGNFGKYAKGIASRPGPAATAFTFIRRARFALTTAPRETAAIIFSLAKGRIKS